MDADKLGAALARNQEVCQENGLSRVCHANKLARRGVTAVYLPRRKDGAEVRFQNKGDGHERPVLPFVPKTHAQVFFRPDVRLGRMSQKSPSRKQASTGLQFR